MSGDTSQFVLSGLASNTRYRVSLQAVSRQGLGPAAVKYYMTRQSITHSALYRLSTKQLTARYGFVQ